MIGSLSRESSLGRVILEFFLCGVFLVALAFLVATAYAISAEGDSPTTRGGNTLYVDDDAAEGGDGSRDFPFNTLQDAADNATDGDTIRLWDGRYPSQFDIRKSLRISGNGTENTVITNIFGIAGNNVIIEQLSIEFVVGVRMGTHEVTMRNCSLRGIEGMDLSDSRIINCSFENGSRGISIYGGHNNVIENCIFINNSFGVSLHDARKTRITDCTFERNELGIYIHESDDTILKNNVFIDNERNVSEYKEPWLTPWRLCYVSTIIFAVLYLSLAVVWYQKIKKERTSSTTPSSPSSPRFQQKPDNESKK